MQLRDHIAILSPDQRAAMARGIGISLHHLERIARGERPAAQALRVAICAETGGAVQPWEVTPRSYTRAEEAVTG